MKKPAALLLRVALFASIVSASSVEAQARVEIIELATGSTDAQLNAAVAVGSRMQPYFCGFVARETGGAAAATSNLHRGTDASGDLVFTFSLTASESRSEGPWSFDQCIRINEGLWIDRGGAGSTLISVYIRRG